LNRWLWWSTQRLLTQRGHTLSSNSGVLDREFGTYLQNTAKATENAFADRAVRLDDKGLLFA
jgi:hypothetical protein